MIQTLQGLNRLSSRFNKPQPTQPSQPPKAIDTANTPSIACTNCGNLNLDNTELKSKLAQRDSDLLLARESIDAERRSKEEAIGLAREEGKAAELARLRQEFDSAVDAEAATRVKAEQAKLQTWASENFPTAVKQEASAQVEALKPSMMAEAKQLARADLDAEYSHMQGQYEEAVQKVKAEAQAELVTMR